MSMDSDIIPTVASHPLLKSSSILISCVKDVKNELMKHSQRCSTHSPNMRSRGVHFCSIHVKVSGIFVTWFHGNLSYKKRYLVSRASNRGLSAYSLSLQLFGAVLRMLFYLNHSERCMGYNEVCSLA